MTRGCDTFVGVGTRWGLLIRAEVKRQEDPEITTSTTDRRFVSLARIRWNAASANGRNHGAPGGSIE